MVNNDFYIESDCALISISCFILLGLFALDMLSSETFPLCFAAVKDYSATPKDFSATLQHFSADPKADIVTGKDNVAELTDFVAACTDLIADLQGFISS